MWDVQHAVITCWFTEAPAQFETSLILLSIFPIPVPIFLKKKTSPENSWWTVWETRSVFQPSAWFACLPDQHAYPDLKVCLQLSRLPLMPL